jgi:hypothetical protein
MSIVYQRIPKREGGKTLGGNYEEWHSLVMSCHVRWEDNLKQNKTRKPRPSRAATMRNKEIEQPRNVAATKQ